MPTYLVFALVLDPNHKLSYFEEAGWSDEWIETARTIAREEFDRNYASKGTPENDGEADSAATMTTTQSQATSEVRRARSCLFQSSY